MNERDENAATVSSAGMVEAVGVGEATITATADGISDTCAATVAKIPVDSVILSDGAASRGATARCFTF